PSAGGPVQRVSATGGSPVAATTLAAGQIFHIAPRFLPDGRGFLFSAGGGADVAGIYLAALDGRAPTRLTPISLGGLDFLSGGWLFWSAANALLAQRLDLSRGTLTGEPVTLSEGGPFSVSIAPTTGLVAFGPGIANQRQLTWVDRFGQVQGTVGE